MKQSPFKRSKQAGSKPTDSKPPSFTTDFTAIQKRGRQWCDGIHRRQPFWWGSLLSLGLAIGVQTVGLIEPIELVIYDRLISWQRDRGPDDRLLLVEITEADIRSQNQWPLSDEILAQALETLQEHNPRSIGIDLYRDIAHPPGESQLNHQLSQPNIVGITFFGDLETTYVAPHPAIAPEQIGFNDLIVDDDGTARRQWLFSEVEDGSFYAFSLRLALKYLDQESDWPPDDTAHFQSTDTGLQFGNVLLPSLPSNAGGYQATDATGYQTMLRYRSQEDVARRISLNELLAKDFNPLWVQDKVVLLGVTAPSLKDMILTPHSASIDSSNYQMPGVEVHAQMVSQILSNVLDGEAVLGFLPESGEWVWVWAWALAGGVVGWRLKHPISLGLAGILGMGTIVGSSAFLFSTGLWVPAALPIITFTLTSGMMVAYRGFYATYHDPLTGLPNRQMFNRYLHNALRRNQASPMTEIVSSSLAVLFLDVDRFKTINEGFGHQQGDRVLLAIARRLRQISSAKIARLGGDEFAILLEDIISSREALNLVDELQIHLSQPIPLEGQDIVATASVGIALGQSGYGYDPEALLRDAHTATYRAKALGTARYEVFSSGMRNQAIHRFQTESDLHQALERKEFFLNYQPLVNLETGQVDGFEALVRWRHPERGIIPPGEFISVAEETGLIIPMGLWILETACHQAKTWQTQHPDHPLMMSVNLSTQQFQQISLVHHIDEILQKTGMPGEQLKLELTESMVMDDVESAIQILLNLKALQIKIGLDDFGTGYSSLSYLHRLPLDTLKIDRSFVAQMEEASENREIIKTIVSLGHNLHMNIIAEGVETEEQAQLLKTLSCEYGQGYYFAKPLEAEAATAALEKRILWHNAIP